MMLVLLSAMNFTHQLPQNRLWQQSCRYGARFALGNGFFQNPLTVANLAKISKYDDFEILIRQPPTVPGSLPPSIIGRLGLNRRVRYGNGCVPQAHRHRKCLIKCFLFSVAADVKTGKSENF